MDSPRLADAIDPACTLLETKRRPRQLEVDHKPAAVMKVQPFACGISREQQPRGAAGEAAQRLGALVRPKAAVQLHRVDPRQRGCDLLKRVAIFGEYNRRLLCA